MRRELYVAFGYLGLMAIWIYWVLERQLFYGSDAAGWLLLAGLGVVHVAVGALVAHWWAIALPVLVVLLAVPAGYPDANKGEPLPISLGLALFSPLALLLVATGVGLGIALRVHTARAR